MTFRVRGTKLSTLERERALVDTGGGAGALFHDRRVLFVPDSSDFSKVDTLGSRYKAVNFTKLSTLEAL